MFDDEDFPRIVAEMVGGIGLFAMVGFLMKLMMSL